MGQQRGADHHPPLLQREGNRKQQSANLYLLDGSLEAFSESGGSRQLAVIGSSTHKQRLLQVEVAVDGLTGAKRGAEGHRKGNFKTDFIW